MRKHPDLRSFGLRHLAALVLLVSGCSASAPFKPTFYRPTQVTDRLPLSAKVIVQSPGSVQVGPCCTVNFEPGLAAAVNSALAGNFASPGASGPDVVVRAEFHADPSPSLPGQVELDAIISDARSGTKITSIRRSKEGVWSRGNQRLDALLLFTVVGWPVLLEEMASQFRDAYEQTTDQLLQEASEAVHEDQSLKTFAATRSSGGQYATASLNQAPRNPPAPEPQVNPSAAVALNEEPPPAPGPRVNPSAPPHAGGRRIALVVGNGRYKYVPSLDNPGNDARLMADTLRSLGFAIVGGGAETDLDKPSLDRAVRSFGDQARDADIALFYYAGHGFQLHESNYLIPVSANPNKESDVDFELVNAQVVLHQMQDSGAQLNVMILDACRNNPFGGRGLRSAGGGLAPMQAPEGTLIAFSTQPASVAADGEGRDSPYTEALAQAVREPGVNILDVFNDVGVMVEDKTGGKQQPWMSNSPIKGHFYFVSGAN